MPETSNLPASYAFWYLPPGKSGFSARRGIVTVSPGLLVVHDRNTGEEVYRYGLTSDLQIKNALGGVSILYLDGESHRGAFQNQYRFFFYYPWLAFLSLWFLISANRPAKRFVESCELAAAP